MGLKQKLASVVRGVLEFIYKNPLIFGFEMAIISGVLIYLLFERKKLKQPQVQDQLSESSEHSNDFL